MRASAFLLVPLAWTLLLSVIVLNRSRYRLSAALALIPLGAYGLVEGVRLARASQWRRLVPAVAASGVMAVLVAGPWWPSTLIIREADYAVANLIATHQIEEAWTREDRPRALRILENQLRTEPRGLQSLSPSVQSTAVPEREAQVSASFAELHGLAATLYRSVGDPDRARRHAERSSILAVVARQYAAWKKTRGQAERPPQ